MLGSAESLVKVVPFTWHGPFPAENKSTCTADWKVSYLNLERQTLAVSVILLQFLGK